MRRLERQLGARRRPGVALAVVMLSGVEVGCSRSLEVTTLRFERTVGGPFDFAAAPSLAWVDEHRYAFIDQHEQQIVLMSPDGSEVGRGARKGWGPGELQGAIALMTEDERIIVADPRASKIAEYSRELEFRREVRTPGIPYQILGVRGDTVLAAWLVPAPGAGPVAARIDLAGRVTEVIVDAFASDPRLGQPLEGLGPTAIVQFLAAAGSDDGFVFGAPHLYHFAYFGWDGRRRWTTGRPALSPLVQTPEDLAELERRMSDAFREYGRPPPPAAIAAVKGMSSVPKPYFRTTGVAIGPTGILFVATELGDDPAATQVDLFSDAGDLIGSHVLRHHVRALAVGSGGVLALVERTDAQYAGQHAVDLYTIIRAVANE